MAHPSTRRHLAASRSLPLVAALAATLLVSGLLSGCGEESKADEKSPTEIMETAKTNLDDASSVRIALSTESMPSSGNGVLGATGDLTHDPAFKGDVKVVIEGFGATATVPITSVGGKVYAQLPFQTKNEVIDPAEYGAPDPADFADPENGLSGLLTKLEDLEEGEEQRSGDTIVTTYTGTLPGDAVKKIIPSAVAKATYETRVGIDDEGLASNVKVTGPFFSGDDDVTYDLKFTDYDAGVKITAPTN